MDPERWFAVSVSTPRSRNKPTTESGPEITTGSASMGRETLVAIAEDEAEQARALLKKRATAPSRNTGRTPALPSSGPQSAPVPSSAPPTPAPPSAPMHPPSMPPGTRDRFSTLDYGDTLPSGRESSGPEIHTGFTPMGRETLAAITTDLAQELLKALTSEERITWLNQLDEALVLEPFRFEVRGTPMLARPNDTLRREFVATKLLHRLPVRTIQEVSRIDVTPTADDGLTLTVWVKIPEPGGA
jgi:hypothetical protein